MTHAAREEQAQALKRRGLGAPRRDAFREKSRCGQNHSRCLKAEPKGKEATEATGRKPCKLNTYKRHAIH